MPGVWWSQLADVPDLETRVRDALLDAGVGDAAAGLAAELVAIAGEKCAGPHTIQLWIADSPKLQWSGLAFSRWLDRYPLRPRVDAAPESPA
jgi:hypothetical protein